MTAGFQPEPIKEYAALLGIARCAAFWSKAEHDTKVAARRAIDDGCRASVVAEQLGMSRASLYRWMSDL